MADRMEINIRIDKAKTNKATSSFGMLIDLKGFEDINTSKMEPAEALAIFIVQSLYEVLEEFYEQMSEDGQAKIHVISKTGTAGKKLAKTLGLDSDDEEFAAEMQELSDSFDATPDMEETDEDDD